MPEQVANYSLDIANAETQDWDNERWLQFVRDRLVKMRSKRPDADFDQYENQVNAVSFYDNDGVLNVNVPIEQTLKEIYMGRTEGRLNYDIIPDGQADVNELQPSKHSVNFFLDGNGKDNFWKENRLFRDWKSTYGSGIWYTGIRRYSEDLYKLKEDAEIGVSDDGDIFAERNFQKYRKDTWYFFPKAIHPKDFFIDDAAVGQPDVQYAEDCIYKEKVTMTELRNRYADNKLYDIEGVTYWQDITPKNKDDKPVDQRLVVLYHYFHRTTKRYIIFANEQKIIYSGLYLYEDGKLPFVNVQHYSNSNYFWGTGIPKRIAYLKAYKSEIFQDILAGAAMSSGVNLLVGNDDQIGQDWTVGGRQLNIWRTTGGADRVQQINSSPNLGYFVQVLGLIDQEVAINAGDDPRSQIDPGSDKVGIVEVMEANKSVRRRSVDENYNIGLDEALTMMLDRIKQFAPSLLSEKIKDSKGKVLKVVFPKIKIEGFTVTKKEGKQVFTESVGKYGYFELKPGTVQGIGVKIITPSTNSALPILERQKINEYVSNFQTVANIAALDETGEMMKKLRESFKIDELLAWMADAYGYDLQSIKGETEKDKLVKKNLEKLEKLKEMLTVTPEENAPELPAQPAPGMAPGMAPETGGTPPPVPGLPEGIAGGTPPAMSGTVIAPDQTAGF